MRLVPVKSSSTLDGAISAIRGYILGNHMQPGEVLPGEFRLSEELGISRNIIREAMQHYRTLGIIVSKPKVGATICRLLPEDPYENYLPFLAAESAKILPEIAEVRYSLETGAAGLMVQHASEDDLCHLQEILAKFKTESDYDGMRALDIDFHRALLESTHNSILTGLIPLLVNFFSEMFPNRGKEIHFDASAVERVSREHGAIVAALLARDEEALRQELSRHIGFYIKRATQKKD